MLIVPISIVIKFMKKNMKTKTKNLAYLLVMGLVFPLILTSNFNFSSRYKPNIDNPKASGIYSESFIHINGSISGNWSNTVSSYEWCYGNGSWSNPYTIENVTIDASSSPTGCGILIENSKNEYFIIRNCSISHVPSGVSFAAIKLDNTNNGTLIKNNCSNNKDYGILIINQCINNSVLNNIVEHNDYDGISCINQCNNNTIAHNILTNQSRAININGDYNTIFNNTLQHHNTGLEVNGDHNNISENILFNNSRGLDINGALNNDIIGNEFINCSSFGIYLWEFACNNTISDNKIINCSQGIVFDDLYNKYNIISKNLITNCSKGISINNFLNENNTFYQNIFKNNGIHAEDDMNLNDNKWDNGAIGNYWDDYLTMGAGAVDANDDGIGDIPYTNIVGSANSQDNFPIWDDGDDLAPVIIINSPNNSTNHTAAPTFSITITDRSPIDRRWYSVNNGTLWFPNIFFTGSSVTINETLWNSLNEGDILIRFYANDSIGHMNYKDAHINKVPPPPDDDDGDDDDDGNGDGNGPTIPGYTIITLITIVSIIAIFHRTKKKLNKNQI